MGIARGGGAAGTGARPLPPAPALSERLLPEHHFAERHRVRVAADPERVLTEVAAMSPRDDPAVRSLLRLRDAPLGAARRLGSEAERRGMLSLRDFTPLGEVPSREVAWGLVGRFWRLDGGLERVADAGAFRAYDRPGRAKLVRSFEAMPVTGGTELVTRTRVFCRDRATWRRLAPYWLLIRLPSGPIRRRLLAAIRARAQA